MKLYSEGKSYKLYEGDMNDMLEVLSPNSIDSVVTDPPYELNFMGKGWDRSGIAFQTTTWKKCWEVLKPGGYLLAFGGTRTYHRIACAIEDSGFEIQDTVLWLYGSGFPKSMNIGLAIDKKNGTDVHSDSDIEGEEFTEYYEGHTAQNEWSGWGTALKPAYEPIIIAQKPCEGAPTLSSGARYFYSGKASSQDRDEGLDGFDVQKTGDLQGGRAEGSLGSLRVRADGSIGVNPYAGNGSPKKNMHPTVKPCDLMQYLIRTVTPKNGIILDPFNGSGSTGKAAMYENYSNYSGYKYIGIELSAEYLDISNARISFVERKLRPFRLF